MSVQFYEEARDASLKFAVIAAQYEGKWLLCRHKDRTTWEFPGGHREEGESVTAAARRELWEETGAVGYQLEPVAAYSYIWEGETSFGALFFAEIWDLGTRPEEFEIGEIRLFDALPEETTYPTLVPVLFQKVETWLGEGGFRSQLDDMLDMLM